MATYSSYKSTTLTTCKTSTATSTTLITTSGINTAKNLINKTNNNLNHQFISPIHHQTNARLVQQNQHNSLKNSASIVRCKPPSRLNRIVLDTSNHNTGHDLHRLERNYSYIEAMKEPKSVPSSSSSPSSSSTSSTSTIESPLTDLKTEIHHDEVEIPIEIKLDESSNSNLSKSRSQSSIFNLFKNTFSPFQIRKWRSKSRDKLLINTSLNSNQSNLNNINQSNNNNHNNSCSNGVSSEKIKSKNYTNIYVKNSTPTKSLSTKTDKTTSPVVVKLIKNSNNINNNEINKTNQNKIVLSNESPTNNSINTTTSKIENNFSYTSSISNESSTSTSNTTSSDESKYLFINSNLSNLNPNSNLTNSNNKPQSPNSARQLSYLKLTCLLNGYDSTNNSNTNTNSNCNEVKAENLKSCKVLLNNSERFYDIKPAFISNKTQNKNDKVEIVKIFKTEVNIQNNNNNLNTSLPDMKEKESINEQQINVDEHKQELNDIITNLNISNIEPISDNDHKDVKQILDDKQTSTLINTPITTTNNNNINNNENESCKTNIDNQQENKQFKQEEEQVIIQDGNYYIKLLDEHTNRINILCEEYEPFINESNENYVQNEEALGQIQTAIGKGQLLINQKFKQFRGLCVKNIKDKIDPTPLKEGEFVTRDDDLAGFWDMVYLQVEDIEKMFNNLSELKKNGWKIESKIPVKTAIKKKTTVLSQKQTATNSTTSTSASKARAEAARQRLLEAKKNAALAKQKESNSLEEEQQSVDN